MLSDRPRYWRALRRLWWSLAGRIWITTLVFVLLMAALVILGISRLSVLERSVNGVLSRNYVSIKAAGNMVAAIDGLRSGALDLPVAQSQFDHWLKVEKLNLTEPGEDRLAARIQTQGRDFFALAQRDPAAARAQGSPELSRSLADLVTLNEHAMFSADRHTVSVAQRLRTEELAIALAAVMILAASGYLVSRTMVAGPLRRLVRTLRSISDERSLQAMAPPHTDELAALAEEFNAMVVRLQHDQRARIAELQHERSKTEAVIESVEDGLIVLDQAGSVVHVNEVACAILETTAPEMLGAPLSKHQQRSPHVRRLLEALAAQRGQAGLEQSEPAEFRVFIRGRDHTFISRSLRWSGTRGEQLGEIILLQDVTFIRDQERARTNLVATLSHELKTPLTSLTIASELLAEAARKEDDPRRVEILATLQNDVTRLQALADRLLDASRQGWARIAVERHEITLDGVVRDVGRAFDLQARERGVSLAIQGAEATIPILGDPIKLPWVLTNLVGNALRYTPAGGRISVRLTREGRTARVVVADTGPGIPPERLQHIFEPYAQFADGGAPSGAAGLGLFIAKEIVEAHNGRIFVESTPGRGSTFTVAIPVREEVRLG